MRANWLWAVSLAVLCAGSARADSGRFHLHLDVGAGAPIAGAARPGAGDHSDDSAAGGVAWIAADYQLAAPFAVEAIVGFGGFARPFPTSSKTGARYSTFGVGARLRFLDDPSGYANEAGGNLHSHLWASLHLGFHRFDDTQFGIDAAVGYMLSVARPLQLGLFLRTALMFAGDNAGVDMILVGGLSVSVEVMGPRQAADSDGDGLSDEREAELGTDPHSADTDRDGLDDATEVDTGTDPTSRDSDNDGLPDGREDANRNGVVDDAETDPRRADTDGGGMGDADEVGDPAQDPRYRGDDDRDGDGVPNPLDQCPGTEEGAEVDGAGCPVLQARMTLEGVQFRTNRADILPESEPVLQRALEMFRRHPELRVEIGGHTDNRGSARGNRRLSLERAEAVRDWFVAHGIDRSRFEVRGYGSEQPVADNDTPEGRARNRRIEFRRLDAAAAE